MTKNNEVMKQRIPSIMLIVLLSLTSFKTFAHDIEVANSDGVTIYYTYQNNKTELAVSFRGRAYSSYPNEYTGNVVIPESVTYDGKVFPVTSIGYYAFGGCSRLSSLTLPNSVTIIGNGAFSGCSGLTSVIIPASVASIGNDAFIGCSGLTSVIIPSSVTSIGISAFESCNSLTSIQVDADNVKYDSRDNCNAIIESATNTLVAGCKNTIIPSNVTSIGRSAFSGFSSLASITIPSSVTTIEDYAFLGCSEPTTVIIPKGVTSIGSGAFSSCSGLVSIQVENGNSKYDSRNGCNAIVETASSTLIAGCKNTVIPNSVTTIGESAFSGCDGLANLTIPNSVTSIEKMAFSGCNGLTIISIPNSVTSIGELAFSSSGLSTVTIPSSVTTIANSAFGVCRDLTSIIIQNGVTNIAENAFVECTSLASVTIPNSVVAIGKHAFLYCSSLTDFYCYAGEVPKTGPNVFYSSNITNATLHVPAASVAVYQTTEPWSGFKEVVAIDELQRYLDSLTDTEDSFVDGVYRREFKNGDWQSLYIPFEMDHSDWSDKFEVARVSGFRSSSAGLEGGVLEATMVESGNVEANYPYLIRAKSKYGATLTVNITGNVSMTSGTTAFAPATIIGNYEKMYKMNTYKRYRLQGGSLSIPNSDNELLPPFRWYLRGSENQASRLSIEVDNEGVTGIGAVSVVANEPKFYDLLGRRMKNVQTLPNGVYIVNGRKQVVNHRK